MGSSTPHTRPEHHHRARRRGAPRSLPVVPAPDPSRGACAFFRCRTSRRAHPMMQARAAPARGLRLPGKLPSSLPRVAWWVGATPTPPRCPSACGIAHTPPSPLCAQRQKAPAKAAARALPVQLRYHRPKAASLSYLPSALTTAACHPRTVLSSSGVPNLDHLLWCRTTHRVVGPCRKPSSQPSIAGMRAAPF